MFTFHYPSMIVVRCTVVHERREEGLWLHWIGALQIC